jgi:hypothetical protein
VPATAHRRGRNTPCVWRDNAQLRRFAGASGPPWRLVLVSRGLRSSVASAGQLTRSPSGGVRRLPLHPGPYGEQCQSTKNSGPRRRRASASPARIRQSNLWDLRGLEQAGRAFAAIEKCTRERWIPARNARDAAELEVELAVLGSGLVRQPRAGGEFAITVGTFALQGDTTSLAVPVPMAPSALAALVLSCQTRALSDAAREALLTALRRAAARLGDSHRRRPSPTPRGGP